MITLPIEFKLPDIGEGVVEGEIVKWLVKEGDQVKEDQLLVEVLTDKATVQIPSPAKGKALHILAKEGSTVKVGEGLIVIGEDGENLTPTSSAVVTKEQAAPTPSPQVLTEARAEQVQAAPAVRKLAKEMNVELTAIKGTGPGGRITREDVVSASSQTLQPVTIQKIQQVPHGPEERIPLHGIRRRISEKMSKSVHTAAHVTHVDEVDMTELSTLRRSMKEEAEKTGVRLTYLPFIIKAVVRALKEHPYLNASLDDEKSEIVLKRYYNIGVATDTKDGLTVPVVKKADSKSIMELAEEIETLSERARSGKLELHEIQGGTFTITNIGSFGGILSTPIINYPEVAILGVHKIAPRPVVRDGQITIRETTYLSLSFDHRVLDGVEAASFTSDVIRFLQNPHLLASESQ